MILLVSSVLFWQIFKREDPVAELQDLVEDQDEKIRWPQFFHSFCNSGKNSHSLILCPQSLNCLSCKVELLNQNSRSA